MMQIEIHFVARRNWRELIDFEEFVMNKFSVALGGGSAIRSRIF
jgi:hypothetical protein